MCGIVGMWRRDGAPVDWRGLRRGTDAVQHRGPDDHGYLLVNAGTGSWEEPADGAPAGPEVRDLGFGFRRLAILDLSAAGHQPMRDESGAFWIVFNGEIYNFVELRRELCAAGYRFVSGTDTEVVLKAFAHWGEDCLSRFNGMWAFAIWDGPRRRLFCARDRFGIKPLYYYADDRHFVFGSEIKALLASGAVACLPNDRLIADYLATALVDHTDETFYAGIRQVPAGEWLSVTRDRIESGAYWRLRPGAQSPPPEKETNAAFATLFEDAIRLHLRSDVPVGTCLSGGLDSSAIVCVANRLLSHGNADARPLGMRQQTFSSCFDDRRYDERRFIEVVLRDTAAEANYTFPRAEEIPDVLPRLLWHQDEPCASSSVFAQWCVMRAAATRGVKVLLDGQGGDELLAGYHTYFGFYFAELLRTGRLAALLQEMRSYARVHGVPARLAVARLAEPLLRGRLRAWARRRVKGTSPEIRPEFARLVEGDPSPDTGDADLLFGRLRVMLERVSLPALLRYEDRNSMAFSLEARVPFLDYRLVEFAFSLPHETKISGGRTKVLLRDALADVLPPEIRGRHDKMGFVTPETEWFRGSLRDWAHDIVHSSTFASRPYWDAAVARRMLARYMDGTAAPGSRIWRWINLELWLQGIAAAKPSQAAG